MCNSQIIVVGGNSFTDALNSVESLKVDGQGRPTGGWENVTPMISKRTHCAAAILEDTLAQLIISLDDVSEMFPVCKELKGRHVLSNKVQLMN